MAMMYPEDIDNIKSATDAEASVFRYLKETARPHHAYICWYKPSLTGSDKTPDFILFGKKLGLIVLEVRDWTFQDITAFTPNEFSFSTSEHEWKDANPDKEAKAFAEALERKLKEFPAFHSGVKQHESILKIPIGRMVVFPNINQKDYHDRGLQWLIPPERVMLKDDLEPDKDDISDRHEQKFIEKVSGSVPFRFKGAPQKDIERLSFIIRPDSKILIPRRNGAGKARFQEAVRILDDVQARLALRLGNGHQVIKGPPGTGKTLVLVHRCCYLLRYQHRIKRILIVCYNIALVGYLKGLIREKGIGIGDKGVHVFHFFEFCSKVLGRTVHFENEGPEYYKSIIRDSLSTINKGESSIEPFDAVFIDEGQDFSSAMFRTLLGLLKSEGDLVIALDSYQDLYRRSASWKSLGIKASGRTHHLKNVYRNTREIFNFSQKFIGETSAKKQQQTLFPDTLAFHGENPEIRQIEKMEDIEGFLVEDIFASIEEEEFKRSEIAIIYDDKVYGSEQFSYDNRALPMRILTRLESSGIPVTWVSQDVRAKEMFDVATDRVSLISIHSSKGLDFDLVYLVGIDHIYPTEERYPNLLTLIYVAITRAKYRLVVPYIEETGFIKMMKKSLGIMGRR